MNKFYSSLFVIFLISVFVYCDANKANNQISSENEMSIQSEGVSKKNMESNENAEITFIELGSVNCIPCRMMQPIMKSVEKKYGEQIEVIFYDVWKPEQKHYAQEYGIRVIPTQVFLDTGGNEIYRHEGFFPEEELDEFLQAAGLEIRADSQGN
ncbi:MAG: thioredoxin family protein [Syntrophaceae bacterium]|nr:thioredoxin family protein [Syntrophaceae bacterium]